MTTNIYIGPRAMEKAADCTLAKVCSPQDLSFIEVQDDDGRVLGKMFLAKFLHVEGAWIDPEFRGNAGIASGLLREIVRCAKRYDRKVVIAGAADEHMTSILARMGALHLPLQFYALSVGD